jgi:tetratricopeptide (TPR) repeat protein
MHLDYATSLHNIGTIYQRKGDYDNALEYYYKSAKIIEILLG